MLLHVEIIYLLILLEPGDCTGSTIESITIKSWFKGTGSVGGILPQGSPRLLPPGRPPTL